MHFNGFFILSANGKNRDSIPYNGVASGVGWPLSKRAATNPVIESIHRLVEKNAFYTVLPDGNYPPATLPEINDARQYLRECQLASVAVCTLLCQSRFSFPALTMAQGEEALRHSAFLGYDYAYSSFTFSALHSDLQSPPNEALELCAKRLNAFGLFESETDLENYIQARWAFVRQSGDELREENGLITRYSPLEDTGYFEKFVLHEVDQKWLTSYHTG